MATVHVEGGRLRVEGGNEMSPERRERAKQAALAIIDRHSKLASEQISALEERPPSKPTKLGPLPNSERGPSQLRRSPGWRQQGVSDEVLALYSRSTHGRSIN